MISLRAWQYVQIIIKYYNRDRFSLEGGKNNPIHNCFYHIRLHDNENDSLACMLKYLGNHFGTTHRLKSKANWTKSLLHWQMIND